MCREPVDSSSITPFGSETGTSPGRDGIVRARHGSAGSVTDKSVESRRGRHIALQDEILRAVQGKDQPAGKQDTTCFGKLTQFALTSKPCTVRPIHL
jgi:hypothetical protein